MLVKQWLPGLLAKYQEPWASEGRTWSQWLQAFVAGKVTKPEAEAALSRLMSQGVRMEGSSESLQVLLAEVEVLRRPVSIPIAAEPDPQCEAMRALDDLYGLGWELRYSEADDRFRLYRVDPTAPEIPAELAGRLKRYAAECRVLLGKPAREEPELSMKEFRDAQGHFAWRRMVAALREQTRVPEDVQQVANMETSTCEPTIP